ncbi:TCF3 fusion partner [Latimeria chalumnae]|uniref:TCF3 fusion partner n=1 Tax=Latimeria chalumnae TaxID=7897 RepID=H3ALN6_LATCH|nr:PREDICTED: TCF3 fusion partner [Latimeria chalumnae]|eukprot:XP_006000684.1 PREDICTED: TCF3 fusion partner [Latimeria chalumnae]
MAAVGFDDFSAPPGSELALPPLFGGNILESELDTEVEFVDSGLNEDDRRNEEEEAARRQREMYRRKYLALGRRCKEIEQVNERLLNRLHQVQKITRRLKKERRFLMRTLDRYGDEYRNAQLTMLLEDDGSRGTDVLTPRNGESEVAEGEGTAAHGRLGTGSSLEPQGSESPSVSEAHSGKKKKKHAKEESQSVVATPKKPSNTFFITGGEHATKVTLEGNPSDRSEQIWNRESPEEEKMCYSDYSSPQTCTEFE